MNKPKPPHSRSDGAPNKKRPPREAAPVSGLPIAHQPAKENAAEIAPPTPAKAGIPGAPRPSRLSHPPAKSASAKTIQDEAAMIEMEKALAAIPDLVEPNEDDLLMELKRGGESVVRFVEISPLTAAHLAMATPDNQPFCAQNRVARALAVLDAATEQCATREFLNLLLRTA